MAFGWDDSVLVGVMVAVIGGCMALWPHAATFVSQDPDGNPIPVTAANVRWMRRLGMVLVLLGAIVCWAGMTGVKGAPDPVLF